MEPSHISFLYPSIYLSFHPSIHPSSLPLTHLSVHFIHPSTHITFYSSIHPSTHTHPFIYSFLISCIPLCIKCYLSVRSSTYPSIRTYLRTCLTLFICPSLNLSVHPPCPTSSPPVNVSVCRTCTRSLIPSSLIFAHQFTHRHADLLHRASLPPILLIYELGMAQSFKQSYRLL